MAAITNQAGTKKQQAMQRAEGLTDIWDIFKAWMGRAAEIVLTLCMFAQLIGMLPGITYPGWANNTILGVQIIMLDFGAFALAPLAEHARNVGQDETTAQKAEGMSRFLIGLVIVTIVIVAIGQFAPLFHDYAKYVKGFVTYSEPVLILIRVGCVVKYIHVIHELRASTMLAIRPTQPLQESTQVALEEKIDARFKQLLEAIERRQIEQPLQASTQPTQPPTQIVEEPTHDFQTLMAGLAIVGDVARAVRGEPIIDQDVPLIEAGSKPVEQVVYPHVQGVSPEKVKHLIALFESGITWRDMPGNYSQTIKPVRTMYEALHAV